MDEKQIKKELLRRAYENLDSIYKTSAAAAKQWGGGVISKAVFKEIADSARFDESTDSEALNEHNKRHNNVLSSLIKYVELQAKTLKAEGIPISMLKTAITIVKSTIKKSSNS